MLLYIIGFTRAGKSTFAKKLANKWQIPRWDTDEIFCKMQKTSIEEYTNIHDWNSFRRIESQILAGSPNLDPDFPLYSSTKITGIVSCGGGIVEDPENRAFLIQQRSVWIFCPWDTILKRIHQSPSAISKQLTDDQLKRLYYARIPLYLECISSDFSLS
nr:shikimate kinase [Candidatus Cloacimonadota bacterium]